MRTSFRVALAIGFVLLIMVGIIATVEYQLRRQREMLERLRIQQARHVDRRQVKQMIFEALRNPEDALAQFYEERKEHQDYP